MKISFSAAGDIFINRRLPEEDYPGLAEMYKVIRSADVRFANLETTVHDREGYPFAQSGGTWAMAAPEILDDLPRFGFNIYNAANNHSLDYSHNGLMATIRHLKEHKMLFAGVGENLADASAPVYMDTPEGRVALIATTSSYSTNGEAGMQRMDLPGRPGVNPLRVRKKYHVTKEQLEQLRLIGEQTLIDASRLQSIREGFLTEKPGSFIFGGHEFTEDTKTFKETYPDAVDMERMEGQIREAKSQADVVLVSIHNHELGGLRKDYPAEYLKTFSRRCIDAGADVILGHGPHMLQGIEIYKQKLIFYSLGDFLFENDSTSHQPSDFYQAYGLAPYDTQVGTGMEVRSAGGTKGLGVDPEVWRSVIAKFVISDEGISQIRLYPIDLHMELPRYRRGLPQITDDTAVLKHLQELSAELGTEIRIEDGVGIIEIK